MKTALIRAAMIGVVHVTVPAVAAPVATAHLPERGEGLDGGRGATLTRAGAAPFLAAPEARQSLLTPVGEGGEGGRGRRRHGWHRHGSYPYWAPPPRYYRPAPPPYYGWAPAPPVYVPAPPPVYVPAPRPPSVGIWVSPGL